MNIGNQLYSRLSWLARRPFLMQSELPTALCLILINRVNETTNIELKAISARNLLLTKKKKKKHKKTAYLAHDSRRYDPLIKINK